MIGVRKNAGTKILIALWASWTTNDTNFESISEQIWSIFRSWFDQIRECKNWSKFERFSSNLEHWSQTCNMLKVSRLSAKTRVRPFPRSVNFWSNFEPILIEFLSNFDLIFMKFWSKFDQIWIDRILIEFRPNFDRILVEFWSNFDRILIEIRSNLGPRNLDRILIGIGSNLGPWSKGREV